MKIVELTQTLPSLEEVLQMACREPIILRQSGQQEFVLSSVDEFDLERELLRENHEFMAYLDEVSQHKATIPLEEVEKMLGV